MVVCTYSGLEESVMLKVFAMSFIVSLLENYVIILRCDSFGFRTNINLGHIFLIELVVNKDF